MENDNSTIICDFVSYKLWYPISGGIAFCLSFYMLVVTVLYYFKCIKTAGEATIQRQFHTIILIVWIFIALTILVLMATYLLGERPTCAVLSAFYTLQVVISSLGFNAIYICLWYRSYLFFTSAHAHTNRKKIALFRKLSAFVLAFYLFLFLPMMGLFFASTSYPITAGLADGTGEEIYRKLFTISVALYGTATTLAQIMLLLLLTYPIKTFAKQMESFPSHGVEKLLYLMRRIRLITICCVVSDLMATALNLTPADIFGTEIGMIMGVDLTINGLLLILSFPNLMNRYGISWMFLKK